MLNDRERRIFEARRLADDSITLQELADEFGVSRERVRQIEVCAFEKVQKAVKSNIACIESPATEVAMANSAGESNEEVRKLESDRRLMLKFRGSVITSGVRGSAQA